MKVPVVSTSSVQQVWLSEDRQRHSYHRAYRSEDGALIIEWEEYEDPAPYDHCDTLRFDAMQELALRAALGLEGEDVPTLSALAGRFKSYWAVRDFADQHGVEYVKHVNFWP